MVKKLFISIFVNLIFITSSFAQESWLTTMPIDSIIQNMTLEEKVGQMTQYLGIATIKEPEKGMSKGQMDSLKIRARYPGIHSSEVEEMVRQGYIGSFLFVKTKEEAEYLQQLSIQTRHKIPLFIGIDAIHGHGMYDGPATIFPSPLSLAASWDTALVYETARITAEELKETGFNWTFSPNLDLARDARWGRTGETYGEDPYLVGLMGVAMVKGYQDNGVMACAKAYIAGGEPFNGLNFAPMDVSERSMRELWLPAYEMSIKAGVGSIMAAHHELNGVPIHISKSELRTRLLEQMNFKGFTISDWTDVNRVHTLHKAASSEEEACIKAVEAGIHMNMHGPGFFEAIIKAVKNGKLEEKFVDDAVRRILEAKLKYLAHSTNNLNRIGNSNKLLSSGHRDVALEAARKSVVLLKNENNLLPLSKNRKVFLTGPNADNQTVIGDWIYPQPEENIITVREGLEKYLPGKLGYVYCGEVLEITETSIAKAKKEAEKYDVIVAVVGENSLRLNKKNKTCGENADRSDINLVGNQLELLKALKSLNKPLVVVLINGRPLSIAWCKENADAIVEAWEPGMYGGQAIAEVLFGDYNPSGKLPVTIPRSAGHIPQVYNHKPSSYFRSYTDSEKTPLYEFGFGLSYTNFSYSNIRLRDTIRAGEDQQLQVTITNTGRLDGDHIVLCYITDEYASVTTPVKQVAAFKRIHLKKGESKQITLTIPAERMTVLREGDYKPEVEEGSFIISIEGQQLPFYVSSSSI